MQYLPIAPDLDLLLPWYCEMILDGNATPPG